MTDWSALAHAYGSAEDVPGLLDQAGPGLEDATWEELWGRLCHQGTVYTASYAALPDLTRMARQWSPGERVMPLVLAGAIVASTDRDGVRTDPRTAHAAEVGELARLTEETLRGGVADDAAAYVHVLQALLAFEGVAVWGQRLDGLNDEEYEVDCPHCQAGNFVAFGEYGHFATTDGLYMNDTDSRRTPLLPARPSSLEGLAQRLYARAVADGHPEVASKLTYLFGGARCAECDQPFGVAEVVAARWDDT
ncbi:hypothetical protein OHR68_11715 [Spirillospora sp. NBC_00431]